MSTSTTTREIERTYEVSLIPTYGDPEGREPYEPRRVRLRYTPEAADALHPKSDDAQREAFLRAIRLEAKEFESGDAAAAMEDGGIQTAAQLFEGHIRYLGGSLVDYLPRNRPRPRRSK